MTPARRALLLVNPNSRSGRDAASAVEAALGGAGLHVTSLACDSPGAMADAIRARAASLDLVVVGGGDGTLNCVAPAVMDTKLPLGIVPLGTANDLARTLGLPTAPEAAASVIAAGHTRRIDLGEVNGHPYFNVASIGFGVDLTRALTRDAKRRWGVLGYAVAALRAARRLRPFTAWIEHGGRTEMSRTVHVSVGNGRHYGGGMTVSEAARIDDGRLDVHSLEVSGLLGLVRLLPALKTGRNRDWAQIKTLEGEDILVRTRRTRSVNADGEIVSETPARFRVLRGAIRVFVLEGKGDG